MFEPEREAVALVNERPGLLVGGALAVVAALVGYAVGWLVASVVGPPLGLGPFLQEVLAGLVTVVLLPFPLAGLYGTVRQVRRERATDSGADHGAGDHATDGGAPTEDAEGALATTRQILEAGARNYRDLLVATVAFRVVAVPLAVGLLALLLIGDTAFTYAGYALAGSTSPSVRPELGIFLILVLAAAALARWLLVFYDLPVLFDGAPAAWGWRSSLRFALARPRTLARYALGRALVWSPFVVTVAVVAAVAGGFEMPSGVVGVETVVLLPVVVALLVVPPLVVALLATTVLAAYHVVVYEERVAPVLRGTGAAAGSADARSKPIGERPLRADLAAGAERIGTARVAVIALVVVAAVVGAAAIRMDETRPLGGDGRAVDPSMDAGAIVENARTATNRTSYRVVRRTYEVDHTTGERRQVTSTAIAVDYPDRQVLQNSTLRTGADQQAVEVFYGSGSTSAHLVETAGGGTGSRSSSPFLASPWRSVRNGWLVLHVPGFANLMETTPTPIPTGDWRVLNRTDDAVVVGFEEHDEGTSEDATDRDRQVRLFVDPETGQPTRIVERIVYTHDENETLVGPGRTLVVTEFSEVGTADVKRPRDIGSPGPLEWLWDLVYY